MSDPARARKLADRIQQLVAEILETRIKDPRLGFITVTDARVTADLRDATVFYTVFGSEREQADTAAALTSASGIIRSEMGRALAVRHTPSLTFVADAVPDNARRINDLVDQARYADAEVAKAAESAEPAGEADPYRHPGDEEPSEAEPATAHEDWRTSRDVTSEQR